MNDINMPQKNVFIDESGNNGFDFSAKNVSTHYIIVAIIVNTDEIAKVRDEAEAIRKKHYPKSELKSSYCSFTGKRFEIINEISKLDITINSLVVDKRKIYDGSPIIEFKDSVFFKFINKQLYRELKSLGCDMAVFADEYKDNEYMLSFKKYLDNNNYLPRTLIDNNSFEFINSKSDVLIQIADFVAGSLAFGYEENKDKNVYAYSATLEHHDRKYLNRRTAYLNTMP